MQKQARAIDAFEGFISNLPTDKEGYPIYPDNYSGSYFSTEHGYKLVVMSKDADFENNLDESLFKDYSDIVIFETAKYSLNELEDLRSYEQTLRQNGYSVYVSGLDQRNNRMFIQLDEKEYDNFLESALYSEIETLPIAFGKGSRPTACASLYGGDGLVNKTNSFSCTLGICGTYDGQDAILTCGHNNAKDDYLRYNGVATCRVSLQRYSTSSSSYSNGDFAICRRTLNTITNKIYDTNNNPNISITGTHKSSDSLVGTTFYKYGASTQQSSGTVVLTNVQIAYEGYAKGLLMLTYETNTVQEGDSGGPVYTSSSGNKMLGIVTAKGWGSQVNPGYAGYYLFVTPIWQPVAAGFTVKTS